MVEVVTLSFDEQVDALVARGISVDETSFRATVEVARPQGRPECSALVVSRKVVSVAAAVARVERHGRAIVLGHLEMDDLDTFAPIDDIELPVADAYVATGIDLGAGSRNVRPQDALRDILEAGRSPLTLDEGIALMLERPDVIAPNWGFSMAGSRRGDQRVPAFWVSQGRPKLGWCWDRNPHTWLGTASCAQRRTC
jgi:hypothetical protein